MKLIWINTKKACYGIVINDEGIILTAAPIVRKFIGQHKRNLKRWLKSKGLLVDWQEKELANDPDKLNKKGD